MQVVDYLNSLADAGHLTKLCQAGLVSVKAYAQREVFNVYQALGQLPAYANNPLALAQETARTTGLHLATVYRALAAMQRPLELPPPFAKVGE